MIWLCQNDRASSSLQHHEFAEVLLRKNTNMNHASKGFLTRTRERISETISNTLNAATSGTPCVMQHPDTGAVLSTRTGFWTFELGEAYGVSRDAQAVLGANVVPVSEAREVILSMLEESRAEVEKNLF
jgi:hypothetical protein